MYNGESSIDLFDEGAAAAHSAPSKFEGDLGAPTDILSNYLNRTSRASRAYDVLGDPTAANKEATNFINQGNAAQNRAPITADLTFDKGVRDQQTGLMRAYQDAIAGNGPSVARTQANQGMQTNAAMANMAGGRAGIMNGAAAAQNIMQQGGTARANEINNLQNQQGGLTNTARGLDIGAVMKNANYTMQGRERNDNMNQFYEDAATKMRDLQLQGGIARGNAIANIQNIGVQDFINKRARQEAKDQQNLNTALGVGGATAQLGGLLLSAI